MIESLIPRVFSARDIANKAHWRSKNNAEHLSLGEFYDAVIDALDTLVEAYQGAFGLVEPEVPEVIDMPDNLADYLREEADWIEVNREQIANEHNAIGNLVDVLTAVYLKAAYKLENLK